MNAASLPIADELARWRENGLVLPIWWRDDDATAPSAALDRLLAVAANVAAPLHLAVIPHPAGSDLAERLDDAGDVGVLVHGWMHRNHAPVGQKKAEFGNHRPIAEMIDQVEAGHIRLRELFGAGALPIFTPPWNRIDPTVAAGLSGSGYFAVSAFGTRTSRYVSPRLLQVNTHLDPIDWHGGGSLLDLSRLVPQIVRNLADRREGRADNSEPFGLLTHHLVHDAAIWGFVDNLLGVLTASGVARWTSPLAELEQEAKSIA